jgi:hypothetical protein
MVLVWMFLSPNSIVEEVWKLKFPCIFIPVRCGLYIYSNKQIMVYFNCLSQRILTNRQSWCFGTETFSFKPLSWMLKTKYHFEGYQLSRWDAITETSPLKSMHPLKVLMCLEVITTDSVKPSTWGMKCSYIWVSQLEPLHRHFITTYLNCCFIIFLEFCYCNYIDWRVESIYWLLFLGIMLSDEKFTVYVLYLIY